MVSEKNISDNSLRGARVEMESTLRLIIILQAMNIGLTFSIFMAMIVFRK